jgi:two-component system, NtrC family, sensor kinase
MKIKSYLLLLLLLFETAFAIGQISKTDSLKQLLATEKQDTSRVNLLFNLAVAYQLSKPDTALVIAQQGLSLARQTNFKPGEGRCLLVTANIFTITGNYPQALEIQLQALKLFEAIHDDKRMAATLANISDVYFYEGDYRRSIDYSTKAISIQRKLHFSSALCIALINLGDTYQKVNQLDSAFTYSREGYSLALSIKDVNRIGEGMSNLGDLYLKTGHTDSAMAYYRSAIIQYKQIDNDDGSCDAYLGMAKLFLKAGKTDSCLYYAGLSLAIAKNAGFTDKIMEAGNFLAAYYKSARNVDSAYAYQSVTIAAKDSLFSQQKANQVQSMSYSEIVRQQQIADAGERAKAQLKQNMLLIGLGALLIVAFILYRNNRQRRKAYALLQKQKQETDIQKAKLELTLNELRATQSQLIQSEKMASLGELTAGIAHEIQNPLNFVNNFSEVNSELIAEMKEELKKGNIEEAKIIAGNIDDNEQKIVYHGKRADAIVKGMLQHSRSSNGVKEPTDINTLADEYFRLAYHGLRAKDKSFNATMKTDYDATIGNINIVPQDIGRVILNLITNAFYAVTKKKKNAGANYEPTVYVSTKKLKHKIEIHVKDNGNGIPQKVIDKIFQPFFTTKPTGEGTGLGLSLSYDIIKAHHGELKVETKENEFAEFVITLPQ